MTHLTEPAGAPDAWRAPAIETAGLTKTFGQTAALRGVDLRVGWGERVVLFGPNGAGKTTLLRLLALLLRPSAGQLRLAGYQHAQGGAGLRRLVGFLGHQAAVYPDLTVAENLAFFARLYRVPDASKQIDGLLEQVGLADRRADRAGTLSRGQQQRLGLARALLHDPPILLLDEPDTGLDATGLERLIGLIAGPTATAARGRTVLLSTHRLEVGRRLGQRAIVLAGGRIVRDVPAPALDAAALAEAYALNQVQSEKCKVQSDETCTSHFGFSIDGRVG
ncbi:MAG: heme ABC exporter ATP-binding protein CcmA [Chloroflexi bacterium]|nr:heme ABC exporter ATP-binding protein CcmA [Chloroflexota bacterium]